MDIMDGGLRGPAGTRTGGSPPEAARSVRAPSVRGDAVLVTGGAVVAGARGDAWLRVDEREHARRRGLACGDLALLDVLGRLPLHRPVALALFEDWERAVLLRAPGWAVALGPDRVERVAGPPVTVDLVTCEGGGWRALLRRAAAFRHFAPSAVVLPRLPGRWPELAWEADVAGVGVFVRDADGVTEVLSAPAPACPRKAAHRRFEESAYRAWAVRA